MSSRDLAEFQGLSPSLMAKVFAKLEKAGIVDASEGIRGGYRLARRPETISFLQIVDAIEGDSPLFECQEIRGRCAVFGDAPPRWATNGVCAIHAVMLKAEKALRDSLASQSLADVADVVGRYAPDDFSSDVRGWFDARISARIRGPRTRGVDAPDERTCS